MKLSVVERLVLSNILPREGDSTTLKIVRRLREALSFDEAEHKLYRMEQACACKNCGLELHVPVGKTPGPCDCGSSLRPTGALRWDQDAPQDAEIEIGEKAMDIIEARFKELDRAKKLTDTQLDVFDRFVEIA